jgi:hypothetical protein
MITDDSIYQRHLILLYNDNSNYDFYILYMEHDYYNDRGDDDDRGDDSDDDIYVHI